MSFSWKHHIESSEKSTAYNVKAFGLYWLELHIVQFRFSFNSLFRLLISRLKDFGETHYSNKTISVLMDFKKKYIFSIDLSVEMSEVELKTRTINNASRKQALCSLSFAIHISSWRHHLCWARFTTTRQTLLY